MKEPIYKGFAEPLLFGHRGCCRMAPENTLAAFAKLLEYNIPGVELDVHLCASGELVVTHDHTTKRVTGEDHVVEKTTYDVLKTLDAGHYFDDPAYKGQRLPLLSEVFDLLGSQVYYDIELKSEVKDCAALAEKVVEMVNQYGLKDRVLISSFNPYAVKFARLAGCKRTAVIYSHEKELPWILRTGAGRWIARCTALKPDRKITNRWMIFWKSKVGGYPIMNWTVDDPEIARKLIENGSRGICSNVPDKIKPIVDSFCCNKA